MAGPLSGIRVLEWAAFHNGPAAGYMLGDLGADVIKIEEPGVGDPQRGMTQMFGDVMTLPGGRLVGFEGANRNKRSVALNLKHPEGKRLLYRLVGKADVFYTNYYRDAVLQRLGLDYETLVQYNPRLIYAINCGYGLQGPLANDRAFDLIGQARSGMMWATGDRDSDEPFFNVGAPSDQIGATMLTLAIVTALVHRERTGQGQKLEVSLLGSSLHLQYIDLNLHLLRGRGFARHSRSRSRNPMANFYRCADGKWLMLAEPQSDRFWEQFCRCLGREEWVPDPRFATALARRENYQEINRLVAEALAARTRDQWVEWFRRQEVEFAFAPILDDSEVVADPQVAANEYITEFSHPVLGPVKAIPVPLKFSQTPVAITREAPELGQHTEEVLQELLDISWEDIASLKENGAIG